MSLRHEEIITPRLVFKADVARVSDDEFLSQFGNTLDERSRQRLESNVSLTQRWEKWNFSAGSSSTRTSRPTSRSSSSASPSCA